MSDRWSRLLRSAVAPSLVFAVHVVFSRTGLYLSHPLIDIPMHLLGGVVIASFAGACLVALPQDAVAPRLRPLLFAIGVIALTCTAAVLWEFSEWVSDHVFGTHAQLDVDDTLGDMALGALGGLLWTTWALISGAFRKPSPPG